MSMPISQKVVKHRNSISKYKGLVQSFWPKMSVTQMGFKSMDLGFYKWKYLMATFTSNWVILGKVTKPLHELSLVKRFKVLLARCPPLGLEL